VDGIVAGTLPAFYCPIPPAVHSATDTLEQQALRWLESIGLCETPRRRAGAAAIQVGAFWGRVMPRTPYSPGLQLGADWNLWGFRFDDLRSESGPCSRQVAKYVQLASRLQQVIESPPSPVRDQDPHMKGLQDLNSRLRHLASP
jgi:hypothetical protein